MPTTAANSLVSHYLYPSALYAEPAPSLVTTVLGTCVAVCLYDPVRNVGGINHYMLPFWNGQGLATPKHGNIAIPKLVAAMEKMGARRPDMVAKVFGGKEEETRNPDASFRIGLRNAEVARLVLREFNIPIVAESMGGPRGRKLLFYSHTGVVKMKYIESTLHEKGR